MELKLGMCAIRAWSPEDVSALQRHANNRKIWINLRDLFPHPYTLKDAQAFLTLLEREQPQTTFAIAHGSEAIGCIGLRIGVDIHRKSAELGFWLGEPFWGRGIMSEAAAAFTQFAFQNYPLQRIYAEPFVRNRASARVLEKAGFLCEGRLRSSVFKDGKVEDTFLYARTAPGAGSD